METASFLHVKKSLVRELRRGAGGAYDLTDFGVANHLRGQGDNVMEYDLHRMTVVEGIVTPCNWDEKGTVTAVAISAMDEEEYLVDASAKGKDLMKYMHSLVRVKGVLRSWGEGEVFVVKEYEVIS